MRSVSAIAAKKKTATTAVTAPAVILAFPFLLVTGALFHDLISVGRQIPKDGFGNVRALVRSNPLIVQVRAAVAFRVLDKRRVDQLTLSAITGPRRPLDVASVQTTARSVRRSQSSCTSMKVEQVSH